MNGEYNPDEGCDLPCYVCGEPENCTCPPEPFPSVLVSAEDKRRKTRLQDDRRFVLIDRPLSLPSQKRKPCVVEAVATICAISSTKDMSVDEFKERIKAICGIRPPNPLLTRTPADKGYYKPK